MAGVGRFVKFTARPGHGDELAALMQRVAASLQSTAGCELYVVGRSPSDHDVVWVNELWLSQEAADQALQTAGAEEGAELMQRIQDLLQGAPERTDVEPLGGVGYLAGGRGSTLLNLADVEDSAARFGLGGQGEARFANADLATVLTGISHQRLRPGARQAFGHRHRHAEEVIVILRGAGRVRIDDEIHEVAPLDAIRVAPESTRALEAGPDGVEWLVVGPRRPGDGEFDQDFWT